MSVSGFRRYHQYVCRYACVCVCVSQCVGVGAVMHCNPHIFTSCRTLLEKVFDKCDLDKVGPASPLPLWVE